MPNNVNAGLTFFQFARGYLMKPTVTPFTYSMIFTFFALGSLSLGGSKEARAASKIPLPAQALSALSCERTRE